MNDEVNVVLLDIMLASQELGDLGTTYGTVVSNLSTVASGAGVFENGVVNGPWTSMVNTLWGYCADSQNNMNDCSRTVVRYINAVCEDDTSNAGELKTAVEDYNASLDDTEEGQGDEVADPIQVPDLSDPDQVIDEPQYDEADRPEGGN